MLFGLSRYCLPSSARVDRSTASTLSLADIETSTELTAFEYAHDVIHNRVGETHDCQGWTVCYTPGTGGMDDPNKDERP